MKMKIYLLSAVACVLPAMPATAASKSYKTPNITTSTGSESVTLGGITFVNQGLVGVGRLSADTRDFAGETLGSFSGMAIDLSTWRRNANGTYSGQIWTLPDRGPNDVGPFVGTTDYRNRVHKSNIQLNPYTSSTILAQDPTSQNQLVITPNGGLLLQDSKGAYFTGKDGLDNVILRDGIYYPSPVSGEGAGRISLDSEAIAFAPDGSFYISDEYAAMIYRFDASGKQIGTIQTVPALLAKINGVTNFNGGVTPTTGRRNNQGLESLSVTPDGKRLVTILQSATVQDTNGSNQQTRNNTRILVYDISSNATPTNPLGHYILELPTFTNNGGGGSNNRTAAQSEMMALNDTQFLVLSRDGIGRGTTTTTSSVYKSVLLVDITGATNLAGTSYENGTTPVATNGALNANIKPVQQVELVNMLNPVQLNKFGMNLVNNPTTITSVSEKWEAMGLVPVLEESAPQDFFLLVGNDNDFQTANGYINGQSYDASLSGPSGTGNNDSVILVYRLSLPTYVDPQALASMKTTAPLMLNSMRHMAASTGSNNVRMTFDNLRTARNADGMGYASGLRIWMDGAWNRVGSEGLAAQNLRSDGYNIGGGVDISSDMARFGVSLSYDQLEGGFGGDSLAQGKALTLGAYAGFGLAKNLYLQLVASKAVDMRFDKLERPTAYGQTAYGKSKADSMAFAAEVSWMPNIAGVQVGPFARVEYVQVDLAAWSENGASLANVSYQQKDYQRLTTNLGLEAAMTISEALQPVIRAGYAMDNELGNANATYSLSSAQHAMGTQTIALPNTERKFWNASAAVMGKAGNFGWRVGADSRFLEGRDDLRVNAAVSLNF